MLVLEKLLSQNEASPSSSQSGGQFLLFLHSLSFYPILADFLSATTSMTMAGKYFLRALHCAFCWSLWHLQRWQQPSCCGPTPPLLLPSSTVSSFVHLPGTLVLSCCAQSLQGVVQANCIISSVLLSLPFLAWRIPRAKFTGVIGFVLLYLWRGYATGFLPFLMGLHVEQSPSCLLSRVLCSVFPRIFWNRGNFIMKHFPSTAFGPW